MALRVVKLKRSGGEPKMQIKIGDAHHGTFIVTTHDRKLNLVNTQSHTDLVNLDDIFPIAQSADQIHFGGVTWLITVLAGAEASQDAAFELSVNILQDGNTVQNGLIQYPGNLRKGLKTEAETIFIVVKD